jgi:hypothetical protein
LKFQSANTLRLYVDNQASGVLRKIPTPKIARRNRSYQPHIPQIPSAPGPEVLEHLGFTAEHITAAELRTLGRSVEADRERRN